MIGNKIADKITSVSKRSAKELPNDETKEEDVETTTYKKKYISPEERQQIIDELRLVPKKRRCKFRTRNWIEINDDISLCSYSDALQSSLCNYSDA